MYGLVKVSDHNIVAINKSDLTIIVRSRKSFQTIDLKTCAENFKKEHGTSSGVCVGDRNIVGKFFCLYTSGIQTMIHFKRAYVWNLFGNKILFGTRTERFHQLQKALAQLGYRTYDLS